MKFPTEIPTADFPQEHLIYLWTSSTTAFRLGETLRQGVADTPMIPSSMLALGALDRYPAVDDDELTLGNHDFHYAVITREMTISSAATNPRYPVFDTKHEDRKAMSAAIRISSPEAGNRLSTRVRRWTASQEILPYSIRGVYAFAFLNVQISHQSSSQLGFGPGGLGPPACLATMI